MLPCLSLVLQLFYVAMGRCFATSSTWSSGDFQSSRSSIYRCDRKFYFGGDAASLSRWVVHMPLFVNGRFGFAQVFMVPGETPMLCGRPISASLWTSRPRRFERFADGMWVPSLMGMHGEYLLPLCADFEIYHDTLEPQFDLHLATPGEIDIKPWTFNEFNNEETIFTATEEPGTITPGTLKCQRHLLNTFDVKLLEEIDQQPPQPPDLRASSTSRPSDLGGPLERVDSHRLPRPWVGSSETFLWRLAGTLMIHNIGNSFWS